MDTQKNKVNTEMPFLDHLEELRWRLVKSIASIVITSIVLYFFSDIILKLLIAPFNAAVATLSRPENQKLIFLTPTGGFMIRIKLSVFGGFLISLPIIFFQVWHFIMPGLLEKEKKYVPVIVFFSTICFMGGALFCYTIVLKYGLRFLIGFETEDLVATIAVNEYLQFITMLIMVFGLIFELPILSFFLTKIGIVTPTFLRKYRRHGMVIMVILSAVITPPDIFTQLLLAAPLVLLYEISIWVSHFSLKKTKLEIQK